MHQEGIKQQVDWTGILYSSQLPFSLTTIMLIHGQLFLLDWHVNHGEQDILWT